ncbi:MAG TPA: tRNA (adenosine(37)-N6)-dimethylallyltransferase MiaA [Candidatus Paceibacterota bacterium]|nr:tRNA (adenosine(37)-N6)-dimethylallyltransferase MiaA [Candidatus Paceibacterota bacterium]HPT18112.1 tRNA (adenosine(37)-N6)-dimethylallyltransferase MiaA [Candidatus Paceibacterota bacterium]
MEKPTVIIILGQTSTGKSDLAVEIAKKINGEIISADSRQVYKGLNLGTGKITKKEMCGIPHYLLDVANPKKVFTVAQYKKLADENIKKIISHGKTPIICGGTGFYIDAVVKNINFPEVPPNKKLRKVLEKKNITELFQMLKKLDNSRAKNIDKNNKVRLIRAIEIAKTLGKVPKLSKSSKKQEYEFVKIGISIPYDILKERINKRLSKRISSGMIKEGENLHKNGLSFKRMNELGLEYRYLSLYLQGKITKKEMIEKLNSEIYKYAKRQMTWFKKDKDVIWITPKK